ncbi:MAG: hypothetical protein FVQ79_05275 [Planctomycetes bacterium]|nr:hypothetical protein [Planctomycetota bacterium]
MDKVKRYLFHSQPVRRQNFSQDITPHDRRHRIVGGNPHHSWEHVRYGAGFMSRGRRQGVK